MLPNLSALTLAPPPPLPTATHHRGGREGGSARSDRGSAESPRRTPKPSSGGSPYSSDEEDAGGGSGGGGGGGAPDAPRNWGPTLAEVNASLSHADEYAMDLAHLKEAYVAEYNREVYLKAAPGTPPLVLVDGPSDAYRLRMDTLDRARSTREFVRPIETPQDPRAILAEHLLIRSRPFGGGEQNFVRVLNVVRDAGAMYWMWAFPIRPMQAQWRATGIASGIVLDREVPGVTDVFEMKAYVTVNKGLCDRLEDDAMDAVTATTADDSGQKSGSFNIGFQVPGEIADALVGGLLGAYDATLKIYNDPELRVPERPAPTIQKMYDATGLWYRQNHDDDVPKEDLDLRKNDMELWNMLVGAMMGVTPPVYAATSTDYMAQSFTERALGDLDTKDARLRKNARGDDLEAPLDAEGLRIPAVHEAFAEHAGRAYAALNTKLGELYILATDNKPPNTLFQVSYEPLEIRVTSPMAAGKTIVLANVRFAACVLLTDVDAQYTIFLPEEGREAVRPGMGMNIDKRPVDPACLQFANSLVFGMSSACWYYGEANRTTHMYQRHIMSALATQMARYAMEPARVHSRGQVGEPWSPLLCEWFFNPSLLPAGPDSHVHGQDGHGAEGVLRNPPGEMLLSVREANIRDERKFVWDDDLEEYRPLHEQPRVPPPGDGGPARVWPPATVRREDYAPVHWMRFFGELAKRVIFMTSHYGYEKMRERGTRPDAEGKGAGGVCLYSLTALKRLSWEAFKAKLTEALPGDERAALGNQLAWAGTDGQKFPSFAVLVALIIGWGAFELNKLPAP
jgi:hypothetical protein